MESETCRHSDNKYWAWIHVLTKFRFLFTAGFPCGAEKRT